MGLFGRLGRRSPTGATPGELPPAGYGVAASAVDRGTLGGGALSADLGFLAYGVGGPHTVTSVSRYPAAGDSVTTPKRVPGATGSFGGTVRGVHVDSSASPHNPPIPAVVPAGPDAGRGTRAGGSWAAEAGALAYGVGEQVNLRYLSIDPRVVDPDMFLRPVPETQPYRSGRQIVTYYIRPARDWGAAPMFNQSHGAIRSTPYVNPPPNSQLAHGSAFPAVYRPTPMPWDAGVLRGGPR